MSNQEKLNKAFISALGVSSDVINDDLQYNSITEWDSIAHMTLVAELESVFDVMLDTDQIIDMSTVAKAREILQSHDIEF